MPSLYVLLPVMNLAEALRATGMNLIDALLLGAVTAISIAITFTCSKYYDKPRNKVRNLQPVFGGVLSLHHPPEFTAFLVAGAYIKSFLVWFNWLPLYVVVPLFVLSWLLYKYKNRRKDEEKEGLHPDRNRNYVIVVVANYILFLFSLFSYSPP